MFAPMRVVSLVPSWTETLVALGVMPVGRTAWCTSPPEATACIPVVGGPKTPQLRRIARLNPDLVVMDEDENTREAYERLCDAGLRVWVSRVQTLREAARAVESLGEAVDRSARARALAARIGEAIEAVRRTAGAALQRWLRVAVPVWREPWVWMGPDRYGADVLRTVGLSVVPDGSGYPRWAPREVAAAAPHAVLLPDEPYAFGVADALELAHTLRTRPALVDGRDLTWFGVRTPGALGRLAALRAQLDVCLVPAPAPSPLPG